ncbi:MAG: hypothetical protein LBT29_07590, partial [Flavobacteriaceae bacterium]|nr:hypothetical protein [Flavobacteriaceae bacterium]
MMKQFIQVFKNLVLTGVLLLFSQNMYADGGWWNDYVTISVNGASATSYYLGSGSTLFQGQEFGTVSSLVLTGLEFDNWCDDSDGLEDNGTLYYSITENSNTVYPVPASGEYFAIKEWHNTYIGGEGDTGNNYHGSLSGLSIDFTKIEGLKPGVTYTIHLKASVESKAGGSYWLTEEEFDGYVATFSIPLQFNANPAVGNWILAATPIENVPLSKFTFEGAKIAALKQLLPGGTAWVNLIASENSLAAGDAFAYQVKSGITIPNGGYISFSEYEPVNVTSVSKTITNEFTLVGNPSTESINFGTLANDPANEGVIKYGYYDWNGEIFTSHDESSKEIDAWRGFIVEKHEGGGSLSFSSLASKSGKKAVKSLAAASEKLTITATNSTGSAYTLL